MEAGMNVSVGARWEEFVDGVVKDGRYGSASEVVREGLRLVEEREAKLKELRASIEAALADPVRYTWDEVQTAIEKDLDALEQQRAAE
jgi:antitoxin ParD1/3/4